MRTRITYDGANGKYGFRHWNRGRTGLLGHSLSLTSLPTPNDVSITQEKQPPGTSEETSKHRWPLLLPLAFLITRKQQHRFSSTLRRANLRRIAAHPKRTRSTEARWSTLAISRLFVHFQKLELLVDWLLRRTPACTLGMSTREPICYT
jgi:hypothetical protein